MEWLNHILPLPTDIQAVIIICLICAVGLMLGKIHVRGFSLGVTFVFFCGILAGVVVYGVLVIALRILRAEDVKALPKGEKIAKLLRLK